MIVQENLGNGLIRIYSDKGVKIHGGVPEGDYNITYIPEDVTDRQYVETTIPVDRDSGPKQYSKIKILLVAKARNLESTLISFIESNKEIEFIWHDSNVIEDNTMLASYMPSICTALSMSESEVRQILDEDCQID